MGVPGISYQPLTTPKPPAAGRVIQLTTGGQTVRDPKTYDENTNMLSEYERLKESFAARDEQKDSRPLWQKLLTSAPVKTVANVARLTSASELATELPVIGKPIENALNAYPGIRTAAAVLTNPLTYATGGISGGVTAGIGAGLGEAAFSQEGLDLPMPFVPGQYKGMVGATLGGLAGAKAASMRAGSSAASASAAAEADLTGMEAGTLKPGSILHTADHQTFTPRRPTFDTGESLDWNTVSVKDPSYFKFNPEDRSYSLGQDTQATLDEFAQRNAVNAQSDINAMPLHERVAGNPVFDVVGEGVKAKAQAALQSLTPGYRTITTGAKALGNAARLPIQMAKPMVTMGGAISKATAPYIAGAGALGVGATALGIAPEGKSVTEATQQQEGGGFWSKLIAKGGELISPAIDPWINAANKAFEALPEPVQSDLATGAHTYQKVIDATLGPVMAKVDQVMRQAVKPMDAVIYAALPDKVADPITEAIDTVAGFAPWIALGFVTGGLGELGIAPELVGAAARAQTMAFGAQGLADGMKQWEAYKQGDINTGQFVTGMGMSAMMVAGVHELVKEAGPRATAIRDRQTMFRDNPMLLHDELVKGAEDYVKAHYPDLTPEQQNAKIAEYKSALDETFTPVTQPVAAEAGATDAAAPRPFSRLPGREHGDGGATCRQAS